MTVEQVIQIEWKTLRKNKENIFEFWANYILTSSDVDLPITQPLMKQTQKNYTINMINTPLMGSESLIYPLSLSPSLYISSLTSTSWVPYHPYKTWFSMFSLLLRTTKIERPSHHHPHPNPLLSPISLPWGAQEATLATLPTIMAKNYPMVKATPTYSELAPHHHQRTSLPF